MRIGKSLSPGRYYVKAFGRCWYVSILAPRQFMRWYGETPWGEHFGGNGGVTRDKMGFR